MEKMTAFTDSEYTYLHEFDLEVIKERLEKATKWSRVMTTSVGTFGVDKELEKFMETGSYEDAVFIAHSKSDISDLIAEVERLREEVERAKPVYVDIAVLQEGYARLETENEQLREKVEEVERDKFIWEASQKQLHRSVENLREENKRLREALQFYADEANHKNISFAEPYSKVASDYGHHARIALGIEGANDE